jgi:8-oxo-dGTP pyrophosphatase MutT (NUDIX family)
VLAPRVPAGERAYRPEAPIVAEIAGGAVVVRAGNFLLLHQTRDDRWCLPKGHVDPGEPLAVTAVREVREESGLTDLRLGPEIAEVSYRFYDPSRRLNVHKTCVYFLARSDRGEVRTEPIFDRFAWVEPLRALELVPFESDRSVLTAARAALAAGP